MPQLIPIPSIELSQVHQVPEFGGVRANGARREERGGLLVFAQRRQFLERQVQRLDPFAVETSALSAAPAPLSGRSAQRGVWAR
jgi:hypothetical protein